MDTHFECFSTFSRIVWSLKKVSPSRTKTQFSMFGATGSRVFLEITFLRDPESIIVAVLLHLGLHFCLGLPIFPRPTRVFFRVLGCVYFGAIFWRLFARSLGSLEVISDLASVQFSALFRIMRLRILQTPSGNHYICPRPYPH